MDLVVGGVGQLGEHVLQTTSDNVSSSLAGMDTYDYENHLTGRSYSGGGTVAIEYDAEGNRVKKTTSAGTIYYLTDDQNPTGYSQVVETRTWSGTDWTIQNRWVFGSMVISQSDSGGLKWYYSFDGHNNVRGLFNASGTLTASYTYDAYGIEWNGVTSDSNPYRYCGEQWDADLGLYFLRARYYNPQLGRFSNIDTFSGEESDPASLHKFLFCRGNPIDRWDPSGRSDTAEVLLTAKMMFTIAAISAVAINETQNHALGNLLKATYIAATTTSIALAADQEVARPRNKTEFKARVKEQTKNDGGSYIFLHGTSTGSFQNYKTGKIDLTQGRGDFGLGFYTTTFPEGMIHAGKYALERASTDGGTGIVLIYCMPATEFQSMRLKYMTPNPKAYEMLYSADCVYGPLGEITQYKFEGRGALALQKGFRGFVPLPENMANWKDFP